MYMYMYLHLYGISLQVCWLGDITYMSVHMVRFAYSPAT